MTNSTGSTKYPNNSAPYRRFRPSKFYDDLLGSNGSFVGDIQFCNWACENCWSGAGWRSREPNFVLEPAEVVDRLIEGMKRNGQSVARISGGEPSLYWDHIVAVCHDFCERTRGKSMKMQGITNEVGVPFSIVIETNASLLTKNMLKQLEALDDDAYRVLVNFGFKATHPEALAELTGMTYATAERMHKTQVDMYEFACKSLEKLGVLATFLDAYTNPRLFANFVRRTERLMPGGGANINIVPFKPYRSVQRAYIPKRFRFGTFLDGVPAQEPETLCQTFMDTDGTYATEEDARVAKEQLGVDLEVVVDHEEGTPEEFADEPVRVALAELRESLEHTDLGHV